MYYDSGLKKILFDTAGLPKPGAAVPCLMCGLTFIMPQYFGTPDQVCTACYKTYSDCARVICARCKVTICRVVPKLLDNGYYIRPRTVLHVDRCNICAPGLKDSCIVEIDSWERTTRERKIIVIAKK